MRIAVIGAGISGIIAVHSLTKSGHEVTGFEKSSDVGGVWALAYPGVTLQNTGKQYHISDLPWPFVADLHPTAQQIRAYLEHAVKTLKLDIRIEHNVLSLVEVDKGWLLKYENKTGEGEQIFDYVVVAIGQYSEGKHKPRFPDQENFKGEILSERDVETLDVFKNKTTVVVGFGKSAVDMATLAAANAKQVYQVFRTPRWLVPFYVLGIHYTKLMFSRMGTVVMPAWAYPSRFEHFLHEKLGFLVNANLKLLELIISLQCKIRGLGRGKEAAGRLNMILPKHKMVRDLRSAKAMSPQDYYRFIARGQILPCQAVVAGFTESGLCLADGRNIDCDQVVLCLGSETPTFPFLEDKYRQILEAENDGVQLFRHLLHPKIPNLAFAGFNHGFMHIPSAEVAMLWLAAYLNNDLQIPSAEDMEASMEKVQQWKREHIQFEPSRSCAVNTRFQQYNDIMLKDLGLSPYRKMPNLFAEIFGEYGASDYKDLHAEYKSCREKMELPRPLMPVDT